MNLGNNNNGQPRSMSTGRNQKSAHGSRNAAKVGSVQSKTSRVQAINEAYNQNRSFGMSNNHQAVPHHFVS